MTIEDRLKRNAPEDQEEIGQIIDQATSGDFGTILRLIINGMIAENLALNYDKTINADRILGRIEELNRLQERLDMCVDIKNQLQGQRKDEAKI